MPAETVGAVQLTSRLVSEPAVPDTVGAPGAGGASSVTSVRPMVTATVSVPPCWSTTRTVTA